ncbi:MAG: hypothetical protein AAGN82_05595 [Myxococcota bacterium]
MNTRTPGRWVVIAVVAAGSLGAGCAPESARSRIAPPAPAAGDGRGQGPDEATSSGAAGASEPEGSNDGAGDPSVDLPSETACRRDVAFRANGLSFVAPTPRDLAYRLNEMAFGYDQHAVVIALAGAEDDDPRLTVSYAIGPEGTYAFDDVVTGTEARVGAGGFASLTPQATAWLRVGEGANAVDLELRNVDLRARTVGDCAEAWVTLTAVIPTSEGSVVLGSEQGAARLDVLAGENDGAKGQSLGWTIQALFLSEAVAFDFTGLGP